MLCVCIFVCRYVCAQVCMRVCSHVHGGLRTSHFSDAIHFFYFFEAGSVTASELIPFYLSVCVCVGGSCVS